MATFFLSVVLVVLFYGIFYIWFGRVINAARPKQPRWSPTIGQWSLPPDSRSHSIYCPHGTPGCPSCDNEAVLAELHSGSCRECTIYRQKILEAEYRKLGSGLDLPPPGLQEISAHQITVGYLTPSCLLGSDSILVPTPLRGTVIA